MLCPKDSSSCYSKQLQDVIVDICPRCGGVWLEKSEVGTLTRHFSRPEPSDVDELMKEWQVAESKGTPPKDFWSEEKLICPKEGAQMQKHYFAGSLIGVDQCQICKGFWFDGGELQAVAKYTEPSPGIDKAWQIFARENGTLLRRRLTKMRPRDPRIGDGFPPVMLLGQMHLLFTIGYVLMMYVVDYLQKDN